MNWREIKKVLSFLIVFVMCSFAYSQVLIPSNKVPDSIKTKFSSLYPSVAPNSLDVWWWHNNNYWAEFIYKNDKIRVYFTSTGVILDSINLRHRQKNVPEIVKKCFDSLFPNAQRVFWEGDARWSNVSFSLGSYGFDSLALDKSEEVIFCDTSLVTIRLQTPDSTLVPIPILSYLRKHYSKYWIVWEDKLPNLDPSTIEPHKRLKYIELYLLKKPKRFGRCSILLFDLSGNFIKILRVHKHRVTYQALE